MKVVTVTVTFDLQALRDLLPETPAEAAEEAGLVYVTDTIPGISRVRKGKGFAFYAPDGTLITDPSEKSRLKSLAVPPAYRDVWLCPLPRGHLQATGIDDKGRKQYRYHPEWRSFRSNINHIRMIEFGLALQDIRKESQRYLKDNTISRERILATVVLLLDRTRIRIGNPLSAAEFHSYGLTTLRKKHVTLSKPNTFCFEFKGKGQQSFHVEVCHRNLAKVIRQSMGIPGYEIFKYFDEEGDRHTINSSDVNEYLHTLSGSDFTAKDFRTWWGSVSAMEYLLHKAPPPTELSKKNSSRQVTQAIKHAASQLNNTPTVCRKYYVYPGIYESYLEKTLHQQMENFEPLPELSQLGPNEQETLWFLYQHGLQKSS